MTRSIQVAAVDRRSAGTRVSDSDEINQMKLPPGSCDARQKEVDFLVTDIQRDALAIGLESIGKIPGRHVAQ